MSEDNTRHTYSTNSTNGNSYYSLHIPEPIRRYGIEEIKRDHDHLVLKFRNPDANAAESEKILTSRISITITGKGKLEKFVITVISKCIFCLGSNLREEIEKKTLALYIEDIINRNIDKLREPYDASQSDANEEESNEQHTNEDRQNVEQDPNDSEPYLIVESVNDLIMRKEGKYSISAVVSLITEPKKAIKKIAYECLNCSTQNEREFKPYAFRAVTRSPLKCINCSEKDFDKPKILDDVNYRILKIQDDTRDLRQDPWKLTTVVVGDQDVLAVRINDKLKLCGNLTIPVLDSQKPILTSKASAFEPVLKVEEMERLNSDRSDITEQDIKNIKRFVAIPEFEVDCQRCFKVNLRRISEAYHHYSEQELDPEESANDISRPYVKVICEHRRKITLVDRLTSMFAPHIIGHNDVKLAMLLAAIGNGIHVLLIGPPGTAKTESANEAAKLVKDSRITDATSSTVKTLTAIVEVEGDVKMLVYGAIPLANGAICVIDEIGQLDFLSQAGLHSTLQNKMIYINKQGVTADIPADTTIVATANPRVGYNDTLQGQQQQQSSKEDITTANSSTNKLRGRYPITMALVDRFVIVLYVEDKASSFEEAVEYSKQRQIVRERFATRAYNYEAFLSKYIQYAKQAIQTVVLQPESETMFHNYYGKLKTNQEITNSNRLNEILFKICQVWGRTHLSSTITPQMMVLIQRYFTSIVNNYITLSHTIENPYDILYRSIVDKHRSKAGEGLIFDAVITEICNEDEVIRLTLNTDKKRRYRTNWNLQEIVEKLKEEPNMRRYRDKPLSFIYTKKSEDTSTVGTTGTETETTIDRKEV